jgi:hypothetical protein
MGGGTGGWMGRGCRMKERGWIEEGVGDTGKGGRNGGEKMGEWNAKQREERRGLYGGRKEGNRGRDIMRGKGGRMVGIGRGARR